MRATLLASLFLVCVVSILYGLLFSVVEISRTPNGFQGIDLDSATTRATGLSLSCILGIVSKLIFDKLNQKFRTSRSFRRNLVDALKSAAVAIIVSPIVIVGVYGLLEKVDDTILLLLIGYQNGFFFQTVLGKKEPIQGDLL